MFRGTGNRLTRVVKQKAREKDSHGWTFIHYLNPWFKDGGECIYGPDGEEVDAVPDGARSVSITFTDAWRTGSKPSTKWAAVKVEVAGVDVPTPEQQVADDGTIIEDDPEPAPPPPSGWQVKRPSAAAIANYVDGQDFYRGRDRIDRTADMVAEMVSLAANDTPADQVYPSREIAMSEALARLERCVASFHDDNGG